jgi:ech hydrogenase subunit F
MPRGLSYFYLLPYLIKRFWQKPITIAYPFGPLSLPATYRGMVEVDIECCIGCGLCARDCPSDALSAERLKTKEIRVVHYYDRCINCGQCVLSCRQKAIQLVSSYHSSEVERALLQIVWTRIVP